MESRWNPAARRGATCRFVTVGGEQVQWQAWVCLKMGMYHKISPNNTVGFNGEHDNKPWVWVAYFETTPCMILIIQSFKENMNLSDTAVHDIPYRTLCFVWFCEVVLEQFRYIARLFDHAQFNVLSGYRLSLALLQNIRQVELKHFLIQDENINLWSHQAIAPTGHWLVVSLKKKVSRSSSQEGCKTLEISCHITVNPWSVK